VRGGDRTIVVVSAFHAAELRVAGAERAAVVLPVDAAECTGPAAAVDRCNTGLEVVAAVAAIESEDVRCAALWTSREEQGESQEREANREDHDERLSSRRARARIRR
jgi:hypothetical protein